MWLDPKMDDPFFVFFSFLSRVCEGLVQPFTTRPNFTHPCRAWRLTWCGALRECIPAGFSSHTRSGRRSACRTSCGWCFCRSSSVDHDSTSRSSSWACFSSCPIYVRPRGQGDTGQDQEPKERIIRKEILLRVQTCCMSCELYQIY